MLEVQKWLIDSGLSGSKATDKLKDQLGIKATYHEDGRVILNYSQIDSPKTNLIVRECRGLTLDSTKDWHLVARSFRRFFNVGEVEEEFLEFDFNSCIGYEKHDGSLLIVYHYNGEWHIQTRGSFGDGLIGDQKFTWHDIAKKALPDSFFLNAHKNYTYVFELCSLYNKIVRTYAKPSVYLLSCFEGKEELNHLASKWLAAKTNIELAAHNFFNNIDEVHDFLTIKSNQDETYEGLVLRDNKNDRWKLKSQKYVALHRLANNGNPASVKNIVPFILDGEESEILTYFPEIEPYYRKIDEQINKWEKEIDNLWYCYHDVKSQKEFAENVKDHPFSSVLFTARAKGLDPIKLYKSSSDLIVKVLDRKGY